MDKRVISFICVCSAIASWFIFQPSLASAAVSPELSTRIRWEPRLDDRDQCISSSVDENQRLASRLVAPPFPTLDEFAGAIANAQSETVIGVYVCRVLALRVAQQPEDDPVYVSPEFGTATQFRIAASYGTIGLLAHQDQSGVQFFDLRVGDQVDIVYGDGSIRPYSVSSIRHFQSLTSDDPYSDFNDLDHEGVRLSSTAVFQQIFSMGEQVVFQTCIEANGNLTWGRLFVIATPLSTN